MGGIRKFLMPESLFGAEARKLAGQYAKNLGIKKALIVTDQGVSSSGWFKEVLESMIQQGVAYTVFDKVEPNPRDYNVMDGAAIYQDQNCNGIVAVGGGSPMDCAKGIGIVVSNGRHILEFVGVDRIGHPVPPLICVPTTAGSSSDVSQFSIILNSEEKVKNAIISRAIVPDIALIDPDTTYTMDAYLTATTGMDTLVHAIEAFVSKGSSYQTDLHALEAIRLVNTYLPIRMKDLSNREAADKMMFASMQAGLAFSNAILGAIHAMAHSLGGFLDLPHGECNAILIDHVVAFNYDSAPERFDEIARCMGVQLGNGSQKERKSALIQRLVDIKAEVGIVNTLKQTGVGYSDLPILAKKAHDDPCLLTNPKDATRQDLEAIYGSAM